MKDKSDNNTKLTIPIIQLKRCDTCNIHKPLDRFFKLKNGTYRSKCNECSTSNRSRGYL